MIDYESIRSRVFTWLNSVLGTRTTFTMTFDQDFFEDDAINGSFNLEDIDELIITAGMTQADAMEILRRRIQRLDCIYKAVVTDSRTITLTGNPIGTDIEPAVSVLNPDPLAHPITACVFSAFNQGYRTTVIFADQGYAKNAPRPAGHYATIKIGSIVSIGQDEQREIDEVTGFGIMGGQRRATVTVDFFGGDFQIPGGEPSALQGLSNAYDSLYKPSTIAIFQEDGLAILDKGPMQNLTGMLETKFEERASFDFFIGFAANVEDEVGFIETVELTGTIESEIEDIVVGPKIIGV